MCESVSEEKKVKERTKTTRKSKAQLLSMDFLIAVSLIAVALGVFLHYEERIEKSFFEYSERGSNKGETIAVVLLNEGSAPVGEQFCAVYSNASGQVASQGSCPLNCSKTVFSAMRLTNCNSSACLMVVSACD